MKLTDINNNDAVQLDEITMAYKRSGGKIVKAFRCTSGRRKGKLVSNITDCFKRKNIKLSRKAKISARKTKAIRTRKSKITKKKAASKAVQRLNKRLKRK